MRDMGRTERELVCVLTDEEVQSRARMLAETVTTIDEVQGARTAAAKGFKERLVGLNETQRKLSRVICSRAEKRMVGCLVQFHAPAEGIKRVTRMDTGELIGEEQMTDSERQLHLFAAQEEFSDHMKRQGLNPEPPTAEAREPDPPPESDEAGERAEPIN